MAAPFKPKRLIIPALFVAALFAVTVLRDRPQPADAPELWSFAGPTMGTSFTVKLVAPGLDEATERRVSERIAHTLEEVDHSMSTWREDSEISAFNRSGTEAFAASPQLFTVTAAAQRVAAASGGALDITVAPLVEAWGFAAAGRGAPPDDEHLAAVRRVVGWRQLELDPERSTLRKTTPGLQIDLSAIAKGFAVDRVSQELVAMGYENAMVEIGGELRTAGRAPGGRPWRVGVERPDRPDRRVQRALELNDLAMATSGDYRNFYELDGRRISHTIDPRTGRPVTHDLASVSVVSASCMEADAWATALDVLGPDEGPPMAEENGLAALFLIRDGDQLAERMTVAFAALLAAPTPEEDS